jgi:hypothetical protein
MFSRPMAMYASPVDYAAYGEYGPGRGFERGQSFQRPRYRFQGRISADGSSGYPAEQTRWVVSNNFPDITIDLGTQFGRWANPSRDLYQRPAFRETTDFTAFGRFAGGPGRAS